jgi:methyltransferase (TIGR00027 family)
MKNRSRKEMRNIVKAILFYLIQIIWSPLTLIGYILVVAKLFVFSRSSEVSVTMLSPLFGRWTQHKLGTRLDEPAVRLAMVFPNISRSGMYLFSWGMFLGHRLTGYVPKTYRFPFEGQPHFSQEPAVRTTYFDEALARHLGEIKQLVLLGAGCDTRSYRMPPEIRCFEVDTPQTQEVKRRMLHKAGLDSTRITFVSADFLKEDWFEKLVQAGFRPDLPSFFLWEGVTMYLDREAVESTLRKISRTAAGSVVAFDYFNAEVINSPSLYMRYARAALNVVGEPLRFGIESPQPSREHVAAFLASCGLTLEEQRNFEQETDRKPAMAGFAAALVPAQ